MKLELKHIYAEKDTWIRVHHDLKQKGYTQRKLKEEFGTTLYHQRFVGNGLLREKFDKLQEVLEYEIPTIPNPNGIKTQFLEKNDALAELIGIILGDGGMSKNSIVVSIHSENKEYIRKVSNLIKEVFSYSPKYHKRKNKKVIDVKVHSQGIVQSLLNLGLQTGNKVKKQVGLPKWIKKNDSFFIACVRGLIDTDGYIGKYKKERGKYTWFQYHAGFDNYSLNLLSDFIEFCDRFNIPVSRSSKCKAIIGSKGGVLRILKLTQPFKLKNVNFNLSELENQSSSILE
ncbi:MAG: LAGLIDADG family homing endonuclease [Candidatus Hodarchaeales archaeon]